jgi:hypothetical protein
MNGLPTRLTEQLETMYEIRKKTVLAYPRESPTSEAAKTSTDNHLHITWAVGSLGREVEDGDFY